MTHRIIIERADGGVSVTQLSEEFYFRIARGVLVDIAEPGEIPGDRWPARWLHLVMDAVMGTAKAWAAGPPHVLSLDRLRAARAAALDGLARDQAAAEARRSAPKARPEVVAAAVAQLAMIERQRKAVPELPPDAAVAALCETARLAAIGVEVDKICAGSGFGMVSWHESDVASLPAGRTFRDAWHHAGTGKVAVHMDRARAIHLERVRAARAPALAALDIEYQIADERGDAVAKSAIAKRKQALRDLPKSMRLDQHATPEALAAAWPADLPRPD